MPGIKKRKTRAEQFTNFEEPAPQDVDPEEYGDREDESDASGSETESLDGRDAREHYVNVGKSKIRKRDVVPLGPRYEGSRISRDALEDEYSDDPFSRAYNVGEDDDENEPSPPPVRASKVGRQEDTQDFEENESEPFAISDGDEQGSSDKDEDGENESDEEGDTSATELSNEEEDDARIDEANEVDRSELRKLMAEEQKNFAAMMSQAAEADVEKGRAVKAQRATFDALLNTRIRLQKALVATNSMTVPHQAAEDANYAESTVSAAETAALNIWTSLNDLRERIQSTRTGNKRKRIESTTSSSADQLWERMQSYEADALPHRQAVLEKWSAKARGVTAIPQSRRLNNTAAEQTIVDILTAQLADPFRLIKRTRVPRSCAPVQASAGIAESADIYDDADFYGLLLKELLEQRSQDNTAQLNGLTFQMPHWQAAREAKTKKVVDTRASKGRKLRHTVHEKLQNFMAPEDRSTWGERQVDELFGSLFGRRFGLGEDMGPDEGEEMNEDEVDVAEQGLMLFRS